MKPIFNQGLPKGKKKIVERAIVKAMVFIKNRYPHICFDDVPVRFSNTRHGSNFWLPESAENGMGEINIETHGKLILYKKVTAGLTTPHGGLLVGCELQVITSVIHELTHFVQGVEKRLYSEVETTANEIQYLKENEPFWYSKLVPVKNEG
jgi:hypothetical protein